MPDQFELTPESEREFLATLGEAITEWAHVEEELFGITAELLNTREEFAAIVFYRTPTLDARLSLTDDLMKALFPPLKSGEHPPDEFKTWKSLQTDIRDALPFRNQLAHHPFGPTVEISESEDGHSFDIAAIRPAIHHKAGERIRKRMDDFGIIDQAQIEIHIAAVMKLIRRLGNFRRRELSVLLRPRA